MQTLQPCPKNSRKSLTIEKTQSPSVSLSSCNLPLRPLLPFSSTPHFDFHFYFILYLPPPHIHFSLDSTGRLAKVTSSKSHFFHRMKLKGTHLALNPMQGMSFVVRLLWCSDHIFLTKNPFFRLLRRTAASLGQNYTHP